MKKIFITLLFFLGTTSVANAGMFDDLVNAAGDVANRAKEATKAKDMVKVKLPLKALKRGDKRIKKIETLAVKVAMKHKWKINVACPNNKYCKNLKKDLDAEAWRVARSKVSSDYAAKGKLPKIKRLKSKHYEIALMRKGF